MTVEIVAAHREHIPVLATTMRQMDRIECRALGRSPREALEFGISSSLWALTALDDGVPVAMLGVTPRSMLGRSGIPWMLGSERIYSGARELLRHGPAILDEMHRDFDELDNMCSARNLRAIAFLQHFSFKIGTNRAIVGGVEFVRFSRVRSGNITNSGNSGVGSGDGLFRHDPVAASVVSRSRCGAE